MSTLQILSSDEGRTESFHGKEILGIELVASGQWGRGRKFTKAYLHGN